MKRKEVILTIDDAPSGDFRNKVDFLHSKNITGIFFFIGKKLKKDRYALKYAVEKGQIIGNHSYQHKHYSDLSIQRCKDDILEAHELITGTLAELKQPPCQYFRFPYGDKADYKYGRIFQSFKEAYSSRPLTKTGKILSRLKRKGKDHDYLKAKGDHKKMVIQEFLRQLGYLPLDHPSLKYDFYQPLRRDYDCSWTLDSMDWMLKRSLPGEQMATEQKILRRFLMTNPPDGRGEIPGPYGMRFLGSSEVILVHDYDETHLTFQKIVNLLEGQHVKFVNPQVLTRDR
ncbi:MAG: polysaccharide deacetylase family protein [Cytophagales bacterium]|nr:polysaccharide deacetylase family protein [Cytophagales bacterium]